MGTLTFQTVYHQQQDTIWTATKRLLPWAKNIEKPARND